MKSFFEKHSHIISIFCPVFAGIIFAIFCCLNINSSIWFDESYTHYLTRGNLEDIWQMTAVDVHPPFFYFLLKVWSLIFGDNIVTMRLMSVFLGLIAIVLTFHLIKKLFGIKSATLSTFLLSFAPLFLRYGQEMRMYTLVFAIIVGATWALTVALEKNKLKNWLLYAVLIALGMWTHYFCALAWLSHLAYIIYRKHGLKSAIKDKYLWVTYALAVILYLPWIPSFLTQIGTVQQGFWISPVSMVSVADFASESLIYKNATNTSGWLAVLVSITVILLVVLTVRTFKKFKNPENLVLLLFLIFVPTALLILISLPPLSPVFMTRYILYSSILIWVLAGILIIKAFQNKQKFTAILTTLAILTCGVFSVINVTNREPEGSITDILTPIWQMSVADGEPILPTFDWDFYDSVAYSTEAHPVYFYKNWSGFLWGSHEPIRHIAYNVFDDLDEFLETHDSFWVIKRAGDELDADFKSYRVTNTITDETFAAYRLEKSL